MCKNLHRNLARYLLCGENLGLKKYEKVKLGIVPSKNLDSFLGVERDLRVARVSSLTTRQPNATCSFSFI